jgi:uncharacterized protein YpmS
MLYCFAHVLMNGNARAFGLAANLRVHIYREWHHDFGGGLVWLNAVFFSIGQVPINHLLKVVKGVRKRGAFKEYAMFDANDISDVACLFHGIFD